MIAIITADIINSQKREVEIWMSQLKKLLSSWGNSPANWEIYRGDEFQLKCHVSDVFSKALLLKSLMKTFEDLDVRIAIGIGNEVYSSEKITESNGSAYVNSGRLLTQIKSNGKTLELQTDNEKINRDLNMLLKWASIDFDNWTAATAQIVHELLKNPDLTQDDLAKKLNISQSSVSQRLKRANFDLLQETDQYFRKKIAEL